MHSAFIIANGAGQTKQIVSGPRSCLPGLVVFATVLQQARRLYVGLIRPTYLPLNPHRYVFPPAGSFGRNGATSNIPECERAKDDQGRWSRSSGELQLSSRTHL